MYYENNESVVTDKEYDSISHQLVELQKQASKEEFEKSTYYYAMHDFDGSTGFDIAYKLTDKDREHLTLIANIVHEQWKRKRT